MVLAVGRILIRVLAINTVALSQNIVYARPNCHKSEYVVDTSEPAFHVLWNPSLEVSNPKKVPKLVLLRIQNSRPYMEETEAELGGPNTYMT